MNQDLRNAERALAVGDEGESRTYAWNALATIQREELPALLQIAEALDDRLLVREIVRRAVGVEPSEPAKQAPRWTSFIFPVVVILVLITLAANTLGEPGPVRPRAEDTTDRPPDGLPVLKEPDGVWLAQLGRSNRVPLQKLADDVTLRYGIPVGVLPEIVELPSFTLDEGRHQLSGDALMRVLGQWYVARGRATVIGVTDYPMFSEILATEHPFLLRSGAHYGVVSTAELGANLIDKFRGHTRYERTRKLVARGIGFLYLRRPQSPDRHSLLRSSMSGTGDIDDLEEKL